MVEWGYLQQGYTLKLMIPRFNVANTLVREAPRQPEPTERCQLPCNWCPLRCCMLQRWENCNACRTWKRRYIIFFSFSLHSFPDPTNDGMVKRLNRMQGHEVLSSKSQEISLRAYDDDRVCRAWAPWRKESTKILRTAKLWEQATTTIVHGE